MKESEKALERNLNKEVKALGGWSIKILSNFITGLPDRLVLLNGRAYFVEVKSEGKKPSHIQRVVHKKLEALGFTVSIIDTTEKLNNFIKGISN
mgnify:CR=1 FL=1